MSVLPFQFFDSYTRTVFEVGEEFTLGGDCPDRDPSLIPPFDQAAQGAIWQDDPLLVPRPTLHEILLSNVLPDKANAQFACQIVEIAIGNGYEGRDAPPPLGPAHDPTMPIQADFTNAAPSIGFMEGTSLKLVASGGNIADWRWIILYKSSANNATHQKDAALVGFWDQGETIIITDGQTHQFKFNGADVDAVGDILKVTLTPDT